MDLVDWIVPLVVVAAIGWGLGVAGFFRAGAARRELRDLRGELVRLGRLGAAAPAGAVSEPFVAAEPVAALPVAPEPVEPVEPEVAAALPGPAAPRRDIEALLTLRWGVWLGAAALLLAGVFLVRYAAEQGLLGPGPRCALAALLGVVLLGGAEWLRGRSDLTAGRSVASSFGADQAPAGLAAGGTAVLFGAAYGAGPYYGLLPALPGFVALAAASLVGLVAALRYGPLSAAVGIAGAFGTPALVATQNPSLPGLFAYLTAVSAAALLVVRQTAWTWLGWATTIAGAGWVCLAVVTETPDPWAAAVFVPVAAALNIFLLPAAALDHPVGRRLAWVPIAALAAAGLLLEAAVPGTAPRAALFALAPLAVAKGVVEPRFDRLPWLTALVGLLTLLLWAVPEWTATGEAITVDGVIEAVLPGGWAPAAIQPLLYAAGLFAGFHALAGLWFERRAPRPLHWAALVGAVPVLTLAVAYARVPGFQSDEAWAGVALVLMAALTATTTFAAREGSPRRAGVHAAGAVAALAFGFALLLHEQWLTLAIALLLPPLAWIEARADLAPLRWVALAVAGVVLVRLVPNWYVLDYDFGAEGPVGGLVAAYAFPAGSFALAAALFRRRGDDLTVATLEAGAAVLGALFVALEIREWFAGPIGQGALAFGPFEGAWSFTEAAMQVLALALEANACLAIARQLRRPVLAWAGRILGSLALAGGIVLLLLNPAIIGGTSSVGGLLAAYLLPALLALAARRELASPGLRRALEVYALVAGFVWISAAGAPGVPSAGDGAVRRADRGCRAVGVVGGLAGLWHRADAAGGAAARPGAAADGAGGDRAGVRQGVPGRHGRAGGTVAGAVVPGARAGADRAGGVSAAVRVWE